MQMSSAVLLKTLVALVFGFVFFSFIFKANSGSAGLVKISENVLKSLPATSQTQKPGTTLLRVAGGVITTASTSLPSLSASGSSQQVP